jgi:hypothetical protein
MILTEERPKQTGTPLSAGALRKSHYNPDLRFLSSEPKEVPRHIPISERAWKVIGENSGLAIEHTQAELTARSQSPSTIYCGHSRIRLRSTIQALSRVSSWVAVRQIRLATGSGR